MIGQSVEKHVIILFKTLSQVLSHVKKAEQRRLKFFAFVCRSEILEKLTSWTSVSQIGSGAHTFMEGCKKWRFYV